MQNIQPLPLSCSDFSLLRQSGMIYVDKSAPIYSLCNRINAQVFLSRPRRFGKSLLVSTFESLFKFGLRDFQGLAIEKLWRDTGTYRVVRIDLSDAKDFSDFPDFVQSFERTLVRSFATVGFNYDRNSFDDAVGQIAAWMYDQPLNSVVLLIDEYDAPLTACLHQSELFDQVQLLLSRFFQTLKSRSGCLRFLFMTGITKFSNTGIFSGFNNLKDISLHPDYGTLLGYTEQELIESFSSYLDTACREMRLEKSELLRRLRENYDGFCFDQHASTHVYCPWSVLNFLDAPKLSFQNYWYSSGGQPSVLMNYLKHHLLANPEEFDEPQTVRIDTLKTTQQYQGISLPALLTQAGYLTIVNIPLEDHVTLGYPNREVRRSMASLYADRLFGACDVAKTGILNLATTLADGNLDVSVRIFNTVFNSFDYQRYPVVDEATCRAFLQVLLLGAAMCPNVEKHTALGRSDLEVDAGPRRWIFEIKFARSSEEVHKLLTQGIEQIKRNRYGEAPITKKLLRAVLVFDEPQRQFSAWKAVDE